MFILTLIIFDWYSKMKIRQQLSECINDTTAALRNEIEMHKKH